MNVQKITIVGLMIIILLLSIMMFQFRDTYNMAITEYNNVVEENTFLRQQCNAQGVNPFLIQENNALGWNQNGLLSD